MKSQHYKLQDELSQGKVKTRSFSYPAPDDVALTLPRLATASSHDISTETGLGFSLADVSSSRWNRFTGKVAYA